MASLRIGHTQYSTYHFLSVSSCYFAIRYFAVLLVEITSAFSTTVSPPVAPSWWCYESYRPTLEMLSLRFRWAIGAAALELPCYYDRRRPGGRAASAWLSRQIYLKKSPARIMNEIAITTDIMQRVTITIPSISISPPGFIGIIAAISLRHAWLPALTAGLMPHDWIEASSLGIDCPDCRLMPKISLT